MPNPRIPVVVKHMTIAIYRDGKITAKTRKDRFKQCLMIARSRLQEYGFVVLGGESLAEAIGLTPKGRKREMQHKREGRSKTVLFDTLYDLFDIDGTKAAAEKAAREGVAAIIATDQEANRSKSSKVDPLE